MDPTCLAGRTRKDRSAASPGPSFDGGPWSIILAGGEGERIKPFIIRWLKRHKPKQYCAFVGTRSMLQHTLARADLLSPRDRQITVIKRTHLGDAQQQFADRPQETILLQPENRDTGPGVFLPLTYVRARDPHATVVVYPSDHFIYPEEKFGEVVAKAVRAAQDFPDHLVLLGVAPDGAESDYGWIVPGSDLGCSGGLRIRRVRAFVEKPDREQAQSALASGGLWNTLVFAIKVQTLWRMGLRCFPELMSLFRLLGRAIGTPRERAILKWIYRIMPVRNFSSGLLTRVVEHVAVIQLDGVLWSDWGRPERIADTLRRMDKTPAFPWACLKPEIQPQST